MKKIKYTIENRTVWKNVYDTDLDAILNFVGLYRGETKKDCEKWLKKYKKRKKVKSV